LEHIVAENRDPKVVWHSPTKKWIMALFLSGNDYGLFASADMKSWEHLCNLNLPGVSECPDLFELPVDNNPANKKWVFWGANGNYLIGSFDGRIFSAESKLLKADYGKNFYAAQTWSDIPEADGRRIQIAWMAGGKFPGMPFEHQMNFPTEVTLRTTEEGIMMYRLPVKEIQILHDKGKKWSNVTLNPGENIFSGISGELFDIRTEIEPGNALSFDITIRGEKVHYSIGDKTISSLGRSAPLSLENGRIKLQILVDRTSLEVFCNNGRIVLTSCFLPPDENKNLEISAQGNPLTIVSAEVYSLKSIWQ
jgi:fructan beta-fructosidase